MTQKIIKVGNSLAVTLPSGFVHDVGYKAGDVVIVEHNTLYKTLLVKPPVVKNSSHLTPEFVSWLDNFTKKNRTLLKQLSKTP
jgi:antitoxin component of MazEF toxin-antitoxin module